MTLRIPHCPAARRHRASRPSMAGVPRMSIVIAVVVIALVFTYINGFHDTANSIATVVATKVLSPGQAVLLAAGTNLVGAFMGTAVAATIASGLINAGVIDMSSQLLICALLAAIVWNLITWWLGLPSSSSHALVGSLVGAALAASGQQFRFGDLGRRRLAEGPRRDSQGDHPDGAVARRRASSSASC